MLTFDMATELVGFTAPFPVVAAATAASDPVTYTIDPVAQTGAVPLSSNPGDGDIVLCGLAVTVTDDPGDDTGGDTTGVQSTDDPADDPADDAADDAAAMMQDPTTIPTGGGPSGRTTLALVAFVLLALGGSTSLLVWSRGG